jgi:hypothetical protein
MKLYDLRRGDHFRLLEDVKIPPAAPEGRMGVTYRFSHVDGMYAPVTDPEGNRYYFAAWTEVDEVEA